MEAKLTSALPQGAAWQYEPKWDGFRCIAFRDGKRVELQSKAGLTLKRYFPEVVEALLHIAAKTFIFDGELIVPVGGKLSFDDLLQRIHPAESRVKMLSQTHPAQFVVFDLLRNDQGDLLIDQNLEGRRTALELFHRKFLKKNGQILLSRKTTDPDVAHEWLNTLRGQLDGVIAKRRDQSYIPGERAMLKIKTMRTADCVVGGFRYASGKKSVGSLLLGLHDDDGLLNHVGFTSSISKAERGSLTKKLQSLIEPPGFTGATPGGPSRWSTERSSEWMPLKPKLVVEVQYDHFTGNRFRHGTKLLRWRPDKAPGQCKMSQVQFESEVPIRLLVAS